jgi:hypothetical protein
MQVRPRFVATLITIFLVPLYLAAAVQPTVLVHVVGILIPFTWFVAKCWRTTQQTYAGLLDKTQARWIYLPCLVAGTTAYVVLKPSLSVSWFISAAWFLCYEPVVYNTLVAFGFAGAKGYKDYD